MKRELRLIVDDSMSALHIIEQNKWVNMNEKAKNEFYMLVADIAVRAQFILDNEDITVEEVE